MSKAIKHEKLTETLTLSECTDGFWLRDKTRGLNIARKEKTREAAFIKALDVYQNRLNEVEKGYTDLINATDNFIQQIKPELFTDD